MKFKFICPNCEHFFTALFGDSYCTSKRSKYYMHAYNDPEMRVLDFSGTVPPIRHEVEHCKYYKYKKTNGNG